MTIIDSFTGRKRIRKNFGRVEEILEIPDLLEVQKASYAAFIANRHGNGGQSNGSNGSSAKESSAKESSAKESSAKEPNSSAFFGLREVFEFVFPIRDYTHKAELCFKDYELEKPKYDVEECHQRGLSYAAPLKVTLQLIVYNIDEITGARSLRELKEQIVYMGDMPLMTDKGTFVVNGTERVIVSQMHRSPGVFFSSSKSKTLMQDKIIFSARVIPYRGSWLDFEFDAKDILYARIDRKRKIPVTTLLTALDSKHTEERRKLKAKSGENLKAIEIDGMSREEILALYYENLEVRKNENGAYDFEINIKALKGRKLDSDLVEAGSNEVVARSGTRVLPKQLRAWSEKSGERKKFQWEPENLFGRFLGEDMIDEETHIVIAEAGDVIDAALLQKIEQRNIEAFSVLDVSDQRGPWLRNTLLADRARTREEALSDIYRIMRPGEQPTWESAENLFHNLFFALERYDLSAVGRVKMNARLGFFDVSDNVRILRKEDIIEIVRMLLDLRDNRGEIDDIDHLGNRRVRSVGELLENQYRMGLMRMERAVRERMSSAEITNVMPQDLINAKPMVAAVREFFNASPLSQFMDQTNPLSEITHKRRLSALGPRGLTRERAGFEVRDVHPTHYGRICPIETPEGPNIGLINSLATHARINQYGFIETPYRKVKDGKLSREIDYLSAMHESRYTIAPGDSKVDEQGKLEGSVIPCRRKGEYITCPPSEVEYIDVSPKQLVSVAAALIPFLQNDDANRALMGSNMQRQAVPLLRSEAPLIGTGMEARVARDSGVVIVNKRAGIVDQVDATRIVVRATEETESNEAGVDIYNLMKFQRSNQSSCINQRPLVKVGDVVEGGDIIADGTSTDLGELALGRNVLCAFLPWNGYNFEDSILISERVVRDDVFTSIHIEEYEVIARDTKLGQEDITSDISNVSEDALRHLDESGIVHIGAEVKVGDVLVGKVTPKGESPITPEEKLLRAIFGEKASDVRDTSLRVPPGVSGTVVEVRVFSRSGTAKDERARQVENEEIQKLAKDRNDEKSILERSFADRLRELLQGQVVASGTRTLKSGSKITHAILKGISHNELCRLSTTNDKINERLATMSAYFEETMEALRARFEDKIEKLQRGDELMPGVMKVVKVFVAVKRKLQPGDKMAGRHGNKGVISRIIPVEDMPHLEDGTPVDIVLNPLGVPSRMNVGQILETHLGWASARLGRQVSELCDRIKSGDKEAFGGLKKKLKEIYSEKNEGALLETLDDAEVATLAENLRNGVPMRTPVFDGASEEDIDNMFLLADLDTSGQVRLIDGRSGEYFDRKVTVGYIYMLKLHHLVDDKIHARSIGPYSLVTQQPLGGKAKFGGQRFGEMEVWALEAYGAAYTLQEILTVKSDDIAGRTKVYESIVHGDDNFEAGIPESFNVLVKELQSLCLNVQLHQDA